jgi:hypothetical protein
VIPRRLLQRVNQAPLLYTDPMFTMASDLARRTVESGRVRGLLGAFTRRPDRVLQVLLAVWRLPVVEVILSPHEAAAWLVMDFAPVAGRIYGGRRAQAVLDLAADDETYLIGRRKQALRTNLTHAGQHGVKARRIASYHEWSVDACEVLRQRPDGLERINQMQPPPVTQPVAYYVATARGERPVAYSVAAIFNDCAVLARMLSIPDHPASSAARYLLHTYMRSDLRSRGIRHLVVGTAIRERPGLQYFQYLLGYEVRNLRIVVRDMARSRPSDRRSVPAASQLHLDRAGDETR